MKNIKKVKNFAKALAKHIVDGCTDVTHQEYVNRLEICNKCPFNDNGECTECGCILSKKAWWRSEDCPKDKWPKYK